MIPDGNSTQHEKMKSVGSGKYEDKYRSLLQV